MMSIPPFHQLVECLHVLGLWSSSISCRTRTAAKHVGSAITSAFHRRFVEVEASQSLPSENSFSSVPVPETLVSILQGSRRGSEITVAASPISPTTETKPIQSPTVCFALPSEKPSGMTAGTSTLPSASRVRFVQAVRNVIKMQQANSSHSKLARALSPSLLTPDGMHRKDAQPLPVQSSRVAALVPKLRGLTLTQDLDAHQALVRHLRFSPNGKFLATSRFVLLRSNREYERV
jgi:WD repeat-containing protein 26